MKTIELEDLRKMNDDKLKEELKTARKELFKIKFEVTTKESKSNHLIRQYKKYIAQLGTLLTEKKSQKTK